MICISDHFFYDGIDCRFLQIGLFREDKKFSGDIAFLTYSKHNSQLTIFYFVFFIYCDTFPHAVMLK